MLDPWPAGRAAQGGRLSRAAPAPIQPSAGRVRRICDGRAYAPGHAPVLQLPRFPRCTYPIGVGAVGRALVALVQRPGDGQHRA